MTHMFYTSYPKCLLVFLEGSDFGCFDKDSGFTLDLFHRSEQTIVYIKPVSLCKAKSVFKVYH